MMKKLNPFIAPLLAAALAISLSACSFNPLGLFGAAEETSQSEEASAPPESAGKSLCDHGLEVISLMREKAGSEEYLRLAGLSENVIDTAKAAAAEGELDKVYQITFPEGSLKELYSLMSDEEMPDSFPAAVKDAAQKRLVSSMAAMINGYFCGQEQLAAASVCSAGKTFVDSSLTQDVVYLYRYSGYQTFPAAVTFLRGEDGAVSANGMLIFTTDIFFLDEDEMKSAIEEMGIQVEEVKP